MIVIGAGFAGACAAWMLRERFSADVTILEQGSVPGGMLRTLHTADGTPYEYGPRVVSVFRGTPDAIPFVESFVDLEEREIYQGTRLRPDFPVMPFPVDRESVRSLPCGEQIEGELASINASNRPPDATNLRTYLESSVGATLTELAFEGFNRKFWGRRLEEMPAEWGKLRRLERIAERGDFRLPSSAPHYYPTGGFNPIFDKMLSAFEVRYNTPAERVAATNGGITVLAGAERFTADFAIATSPLDALLGYRYGPLEWRGYRLEVQAAGRDEPVLGTAPDGIPFSWLYTPWPETDVCRTTDFRVIHHGPRADLPGVVTREIADDSVRMYPVWWEQEKVDRYLAAAARIRGLLPLGRLGLYKYVTIDTTYAMVQRLIDKLDRYLDGDEPERLNVLKAIRGGWQN